MSKFLITGVFGFVAPCFIRYLKENHPDTNIFGVDISENNESSDLHYTFQNLDLMDKQQVHVLIQKDKPDLAAISSFSQSWKQPAECFKNNTKLFLNLVKGIRENAILLKLILRQAVLQLTGTMMFIGNHSRLKQGLNRHLRYTLFKMLCNMVGYWQNKLKKEKMNLIYRTI